MQVKSQEDDIAEDLIQQLKGCMDEGDYGLFVALSHFKNNALRFLDKTPRIRGIDCDEFIDLFIKYYDKLSEECQKAIPLRKVYVPMVDEPEE